MIVRPQWRKPGNMHGFVLGGQFYQPAWIAGPALTVTAVDVVFCLGTVTRRAPDYVTLISDGAHVLQTIVVRLHAHQVGVVVLTPETLDPIGV